MRPAILLTGATGSLGRELLPRLLSRMPEADMVLLLRARDGAAAAERLEELRAYLRLYAPKAPTRALAAVEGDVTRPRLGLDPARYAELAARVTHIVHAAADIGLGRELEHARGVNVGGVREVLAFAERCPRLEHLAHVSTAYVAGTRAGAIREAELECGQGFRNPYERSKCEAETWMRARMSRLPITVFRPAILVGDSRDGHTCNFGNIYLPLKLTARGLLRDIPGRGGTRLDLVPTDYAAEVIARLTCRPSRRCCTYHVTAGSERAVRVRDLLEAVIARFDRGGRRPLRFDEPESDGAGGAPRGDAPAPARDAARQGTAPGNAVSARRARRGAEPLAPFFSYLDGGQDFDDSTLRADLGAAGPRFPAPHEYLPRILDFCEETDWGRELPWKVQPCQPAA